MAACPRLCRRKAPPMQAHGCSICSIWEAYVSAGHGGQRAVRGVRAHMDDNWALRELGLQSIPFRACLPQCNNIKKCTPKQ